MNVENYATEGMGNIKQPLKKLIPNMLTKTEDNIIGKEDNKPIMDVNLLYSAYIKSNVFKETFSDDWYNLGKSIEETKNKLKEVQEKNERKKSLKIKSEVIKKPILDKKPKINLIKDNKNSKKLKQTYNEKSICKSSTDNNKQCKAFRKSKSNIKGKLTKGSFRGYSRNSHIQSIVKGLTSSYLNKKL